MVNPTQVPVSGPLAEFGPGFASELLQQGYKTNPAGLQINLMAHTPPILARLSMDATPVLSYLGKADPFMFGAPGPVSMLRAFAHSVGRSFIKGQSLGRQLCPEKT